MYIIGLDTSGYTTSLAVTGEKGIALLDERKLLDVKPGEKGLRQSEALFQHLQNIPLLIKKAGDIIPLKRTVAVAASVKPRPVEGSYMPVFRVGENFGTSFANLLNVPFYPTTHQEGHIWAALYSMGLNEDFPGRFLALHLSGGTTELLEVSRKGVSLEIEKMGGTSDLPLGQFIDRVGVKMGLSFPCGPYLEKLARDSQDPVEIPVSVQGSQVSYSGPLTRAERLLEEGSRMEDLARGVEISAARSLVLVIKNILERTGLDRVVITGGVASNQYIKKYLQDNLRDSAPNLFFTPGELAGDNGVGVAFYGWKRFNLKNN